MSNKTILLNGVDGNFGHKCAETLLANYDHSLLIFTAPTEKGLEPFKGLGVDTRVADFNNPDTLAKAFKEPTP